MEEMDRRNQHRCAHFGLTVHPKHQGKGYGTEAMEWMLERAFVGFGLNRVQGEPSLVSRVLSLKPHESTDELCRGVVRPAGNVFAWNKPAFRVYEKV